MEFNCFCALHNDRSVETYPDKLIHNNCELILVFAKRWRHICENLPLLWLSIQAEFYFLNWKNWEILGKIEIENCLRKSKFSVDVTCIVKTNSVHTVRFWYETLYQICLNFWFFHRGQATFSSSKFTIFLK